MTLLVRDLVTTLDAVTATRSRLAKRAALAELLTRAEPDEVEPLVGLLLGKPRQGKLGVGWRTLPRDLPVTGDGGRLTLRQLDADLTRLARLAGPGSAGTRRDTLHELYAGCDAAERDLLSRVLIGEMRTGALDGLLVDAVAQAAGIPVATVRRAAMLTGSLASTTLTALTAPAELEQAGLAPMVPVLPMLASSAPDVAAALAITGEASVEHKLDGARIQVHRDGDDVLVVTRSLADVTARVPEIVEIVRAAAARRLVLDGETLALDEDGAPRPFQDTMSRFGAEAARETLLHPRFFDLLHLNGRDLLDEPLHVRREALRAVLPAYLVEGTTTADPVVAQQVFDEALAAGHEGVVVKALDAPYAAGRRGKSWVKVKPVHTLDLVVLAAEWGSGRRRGWLSNLHLGARDGTRSLGDPAAFVMVGKTFKGLTDELLRWQTETFPEHADPDAEPSDWLVRLRPELVVEIAIDGVQRSSRYPGGVALRFARVKGYRPDKSPGEADTIETVRSRLPG